MSVVYLPMLSKWRYMRFRWHAVHRPQLRRSGERTRYISMIGEIDEDVREKSRSPCRIALAFEVGDSERRFGRIEWRRCPSGSLGDAPRRFRDRS
jgi:hypothetical protein